VPKLEAGTKTAHTGYIGNGSRDRNLKNLSISPQSTFNKRT